MGKCISMKSKAGITMISLIVTIIILLILAGVTIAMLTNSGIIDKANDAAKLTNLSEIREQLGLDILDKQSELMSGEEKRGELTQEELEDIIEKYGELQDDGDTIVTEYGNISLKEIMSGNVTVADTDTSEGGDKTGSDNNSQEVAELKQQIEDLKNQVVELKETTNELNTNKQNVGDVLYENLNLNVGQGVMHNLNISIKEYKFVDVYITYSNSNNANILLQNSTTICVQDNLRTRYDAMNGAYQNNTYYHIGSTVAMNEGMITGVRLDVTTYTGYRITGVVIVGYK